MTELPENFNNIEHLQKTWNQEHNRRVDRYFKDVEGTGNLSSIRASLKLACRALDEDNMYASWMRSDLFYNVIGYGKKNLAVFYGNRLDTSPPVAGHPQLFFVFSQDGAASPPEESPIQHEKSVRLMKYSCAAGNAKPAITKAIMTEIANEIKSTFLSGNKGITYTCGNKSASYTDPDHGFPKGNYILVNSKADGVEIYQKICNVIDVPFQSEKVIVNDPDKASTTTATAGKVTILGKQVQNRRYRPVAILRFRSAYISLGNLVPPVFLLDTTFQNQGLVKYP